VFHRLRDLEVCPVGCGVVADHDVPDLRGGGEALFGAQDGAADDGWEDWEIG